MIRQPPGRYRAATLKYLVQALDRQEVEAQNRPILTYLAGELNRRLGRFDEALQWFSRVEPGDPRLGGLVGRQAALARKKDDQPDRTSSFH
jgi:hypothetical protein